MWEEGWALVYGWLTVDWWGGMKAYWWDDSMVVVKAGLKAVVWAESLVE